jgi:methylamine dehydrogenase accessory protein MauD
MLTLWIVVIVLGVLQLFEIGLLVLLLRGLGELKQQGFFSKKPSKSPDEWGLPIGEQAPLFDAVDQHGQTIRLKDMHGRKCLLAFISPGCAPCVETIEMLNRFLQENLDIAVLLIGSTDRRHNSAFANEYSVTIPIVTLDAKISDHYGIKARPFGFVLDESGTIRAKGPLNQREHLDVLLTIAFPLQPVAH